MVRMRTLCLVALTTLLIGCNNTSDSFKSTILNAPTFESTDLGYIFYRSAAQSYIRQSSKDGISIKSEFLANRNNEAYALNLLHMMLVDRDAELIELIENKKIILTEPEQDLVKAWASISRGKKQDAKYVEQIDSVFTEN